MKIPKLIAICGYKRCGKDTVSDYIASLYGHKHIKIAAKLKEVSKILFNFTDAQVETDIKEEIDDRWGTTPRKVMQFMGTEMFQYKIQEIIPGIKRNFWIKSLIEEHIITTNQSYPIVISDMRFVHEYTELKQYGVFVIKIKRHLPQIDTHPSETEFMNIPADLEIDNNGTVCEMLRQITKHFECND